MAAFRRRRNGRGKKTEEGEPKDGDKAGDPHHDGPNDWKNSGSWGPTPGCPDRVPREDEEKPDAAEGEDSRKDAKDSDLFLQVTPVVEAPVVEVKDNSRTKNVGATENVLRLPKKRLRLLKSRTGCSDFDLREQEIGSSHQNWSCLKCQPL